MAWFELSDDHVYIHIALGPTILLKSPLLTRQIDNDKFLKLILNGKDSGKNSRRPIMRILEIIRCLNAVRKEKNGYIDTQNF